MGRSPSWGKGGCGTYACAHRCFPLLERSAARKKFQRPPHMTVREASLTDQCISSHLISAGSASLHTAHSPCSFVAAHRSGEHGAVGRGRSRSAPEGHTAWSASSSRSRMLQPCLRSSLRPVTLAHSKLRPVNPPNLHHCLADGGRDQFLSGRCIRGKMT